MVKNESQRRQPRTKAKDQTQGHNSKDTTQRTKAKDEGQGHNSRTQLKDKTQGHNSKDGSQGARTRLWLKKEGSLAEALCVYVMRCLLSEQMVNPGCKISCMCMRYRKMHRDGCVRITKLLVRSTVFTHGESYREGFARVSLDSPDSRSQTSHSILALRTPRLPVRHTQRI
jgi:hypothetical protein